MFVIFIPFSNSFFFFVNACAVLTSVSPAPPTGGDVLGGGQSDHEEVQEPEESWGAFHRFREEEEERWRRWRVPAEWWESSWGEAAPPAGQNNHSLFIRVIGTVNRKLSLNFVTSHSSVKFFFFYPGKKADIYWGILFHVDVMEKGEKTNGYWWGRSCAVGEEAEMMVLLLLLISLLTFESDLYYNFSHDNMPRNFNPSQSLTHVWEFVTDLTKRTLVWTKISDVKRLILLVVFSFVSGFVDGGHRWWRGGRTWWFKFDPWYKTKLGEGLAGAHPPTLTQTGAVDKLSLEIKLHIFSFIFQKWFFIMLTFMVVKGFTFIPNIPIFRLH